METSREERYQRYRRYFVNLGQFYQQKKVRIYTGIVLSLLTVAFFLFFAIRPTLTTIAALTKEIKDKKSITEKLDDKIKALNAAQVEQQKIAKDLLLVEVALPDNPHLSLLAPQLEALARENGASLRSIQFSEAMLKGQEEEKDPQADKEDQGLGFNLVVVGDYQNLRSFLDSLIDLRRTISVEGFAFSSEKETGLVLTLKAKAHYLTQSIQEE